MNRYDFPLKKIFKNNIKAKIECSFLFLDPNVHVGIDYELKVF